MGSKISTAFWLASPLSWMCLALAGFTVTADAQPARPRPPKLGDVLPEVGRSLGPWVVQSIQLACTTIKEPCTYDYALLEHGRWMAIAFLAPPKSNSIIDSKNDVIAQTFVAERTRSEEWAIICDRPVAGFKIFVGANDKRKEQFRGFYLRGGELSVVHQQYREFSPCHDGNE